MSIERLSRDTILEYWSSCAKEKLQYYYDATSSTSNKSTLALYRHYLQEEASALLELASQFKTRMNALVPVARLPPEVVAHVFSFLVDPNPSPPNSHYFDEDLKNASQVCRRWRNIALDTSTLWAKIDLAWPERWTDEMFERAKLAPLRILSNDPAYAPTRLQHYLVQQHMGQVQTLSMHSDTEYSPDEAAKTQRFYQGLTAPAPLLEDLALTFVSGAIHGRLPDNLFSNQAPRLCSVDLCNVTNFSWTPTTFGNLTRLSIAFHNAEDHLIPPPSSPTSTVLHGLRHMPRLEELCLVRAVPPPGSPPSTPVSLPNLKFLKLVSGVHECVRFMQSLDIPRFVRTEIRPACATVEDIQAFLPVVSAHFSRSNSTFDAVSVMSADCGEDHVFGVWAWRKERERPDSEELRDADLALTFVVPFDLTVPTYSSLLRAVAHAVPAILRSAGVLDIGGTDWTAAEWLALLGTSAAVHTLNVSRHAKALCAALRMSVAAPGDTDWRAKRRGAQVFCCPALQTLCLTGCTVKGPRRHRKRPPPADAVSLAACVRIRAAGGARIEAVTLDECSLGLAALHELRACCARLDLMYEVVPAHLRPFKRGRA